MGRITLLTICGEKKVVGRSVIGQGAWKGQGVEIIMQDEYLDVRMGNITNYATVSANLYIFMA